MNERELVLYVFRRLTENTDLFRDVATPAKIVLSPETPSQQGLDNLGSINGSLFEKHPDGFGELFLFSSEPRDR